MKRSFPTRGALALVVSLAVFSVERSVAESDAPEEARRGERAADLIAELISELGAPTYARRQAAQERLRQRGLSAFDQLLAASTDSDPEIAAASQRLLKTLTIRWTRRGDSPWVRRLLETYGALDEQERRDRVMQLSGLEEEGVAALCRIARFDPSDRVSREAAVQLIFAGDFQAVKERVEAVTNAEAALTREFGPSGRPAAAWLRLFVLQHRDAAASIPGWRRAVAAEQRAVDDLRPETDERLLAGLRWNWLRAQLSAVSQAGGGAGDAEESATKELLATVDRLAATSPRGGEAVLTRALEWMVSAGADAGVDALLESRREELTTKQGLYLAAIVRDKQGRLEEAAELASKAFEKPPAAGDERVDENRKLTDGRVPAGRRLEERGYAEWARREYAEAAEQTPAVSVNAVYARTLLANSYFDHEKNAEAAATLALVTEAVAEDLQSRARYENLVDEYEFLPSVSSLNARQRYYQSFVAKEAGDTATEVSLLRECIDLDASDADFLIALFQAAQSGGGEALKAEASEHIRKLANELQDGIDASPDDAVGYNHWAWLVSNTEGDFAKALRYSRRSLEIRPGDAGYLDTLGRCYYAVGDLEQAVAQQREACRREPHLRVLQRQLEFFEAELARSKQQADAAEENGATGGGEEEAPTGGASDEGVDQGDAS